MPNQSDPTMDEDELPETFEELHDFLLRRAAGFVESLEIIETSELYAKQRDEWRGYLKGQKVGLENAALAIKILLLKQTLAEQSKPKV